MAERARKHLVGTVLSHKMQKTAIVQVMRLVQHPIYRKVVKRRKKYVAHDEKNSAKVGDQVQIQETRPLSRTKRWRIVQVLRTT